jgi:hypothetical protein
MGRAEIPFCGPIGHRVERSIIASDDRMIESVEKKFGNLHVISASVRKAKAV